MKNNTVVTVEIASKNMITLRINICGKYTKCIYLNGKDLRSLTDLNTF